MKRGPKGVALRDPDPLCFWLRVIHELWGETKREEPELTSRIEFLNRHQTLFSADFELALDVVNWNGCTEKEIEREKAFSGDIFQ